MAAQHYLNDGYEVFVPLMKQGAADFVTMKDGKCQRVQVKLAVEQVTRSGRKTVSVMTLSSSRTRRYKERIRDFDIFFVVYDRRKWAIPVGEIEKTRIYLVGASPETVAKWTRYEIV